MPETISQRTRKAMKPHICDYCNETIFPGELYDHSVLKYDDVYTWKSHMKCIEIATELWNFVDPMDCGMSGEEFQDACMEFCRIFICPDCDSWDNDSDDCQKDERFCIDKIHAFLQKNDFRRARDKYGHICWKCFPKKEG